MRQRVVDVTLSSDYLAAACSQQEWQGLLVLELLFCKTKDFSLIKAPSQELHRGLNLIKYPPNTLILLPAS